MMAISLLFFFFQAEDGIRDSSVTGVQTCALPICCHIILQPERRMWQLHSRPSALVLQCGCVKRSLDRRSGWFDGSQARSQPRVLWTTHRVFLRLHLPCRLFSEGFTRIAVTLL